LPDDAGPPEPLLVERRVQTGEDAYADRVTADGGVWSGGTVSATLEEGEWRFGREDPAWRREATLAPEALAALREAIAGSGVMQVEPEHRPDVTVIHASQEIWTVELDGERRTVVLHARGVTKVPALQALNEALERALASTDRG
jgi:hypothetical protein